MLDKLSSTSVDCDDATCATVPCVGATIAVAVPVERLIETFEVAEAKASLINLLQVLHNWRMTDEEAIIAALIQYLNVGNYAGFVVYLRSTRNRHDDGKLRRLVRRLTSSTNEEHRVQGRVVVYEATNAAIKAVKKLPVTENSTRLLRNCVLVRACEPQPMDGHFAVDSLVAGAGTRLAKVSTPQEPMPLAPPYRPIASTLLALERSISELTIRWSYQEIRHNARSQPQVVMLRSA